VWLQEVLLLQKDNLSRASLWRNFNFKFNFKLWSLQTDTMFFEICSRDFFPVKSYFQFLSYRFAVSVVEGFGCGPEIMSLPIAWMFGELNDNDLKEGTCYLTRAPAQLCSSTLQHLFILRISDHLRRTESFWKDSQGFRLSKRVTQFIELNEFATKTWECFERCQVFICFCSRLDKLWVISHVEIPLSLFEKT
jgi:hypothetical protein